MNSDSAVVNLRAMSSKASKPRLLKRALRFRIRVGHHQVRVMRQMPGRYRPVRNCHQDVFIGLDKVCELRREGRKAEWKKGRKGRKRKKEGREERMI